MRHRKRLGLRQIINITNDKGVTRTVATWIKEKRRTKYPDGPIEHHKRK